MLSRKLLRLVCIPISPYRHYLSNLYFSRIMGSLPSNYPPICTDFPYLPAQLLEQKGPALSEWYLDLCALLGINSVPQIGHSTGLTLTLVASSFICSDLGLTTRLLRSSFVLSLSKWSTVKPSRDIDSSSSLINLGKDTVLLYPLSPVRTTCFLPSGLVYGPYTFT